MSDILIERCGVHWTLRHPRLLFERFDSRALAVRKAGRLRPVLERPGSPCAVRFTGPGQARRPAV